jgi:hypothetical protein
MDTPGPGDYDGASPPKVRGGVILERTRDDVEVKMVEGELQGGGGLTAKRCGAPARQTTPPDATRVSRRGGGTFQPLPSKRPELVPPLPPPTNLRRIPHARSGRIRPPPRVCARQRGDDLVRDAKVGRGVAHLFLYPPPRTSHGEAKDVPGPGTYDVGGVQLPEGGSFNLAQPKGYLDWAILKGTRDRF